MDNLIELAMQIILCLLIAAVLGAIIGYLLGKMSKCDKDDYNYNLEKKKLNDYSEDDDLLNIAATGGTNKEKSTVNAAMSTKISEPIGQEIGIRPQIVSTPALGEMDDLKEISGVGLKIEGALHSLGVYSFEQIAHWSPENIEWVENYLVFKGRIKKEDWIAQAKLLAAGGHTEFSKKIKQGENPPY